jgi:hypothetical protein
MTHTPTGLPSREIRGPCVAFRVASNLRRALADTGREHEAVEAAEDRGERPDLLDCAVDEIVDRQARAGLGAREEIAHVVAHPRYSEQTRLLVEDRLDLADRQPQPLKEIEDDARIQGARPCAHAQAVERGEPERRVDAPGVLHRAQAGAAAEVRDDHPAVGDVGCDVRQGRRDVFVRQPVKTVALHAGAANLARQRHELRDRGLPAMEAGVEAGDLRNAGQIRADGFDRGEVVRLMQRRERDQRPQILEDLRRHDRRPEELRPAVHDPMADAEDAGAAVAGAHPPGERLERGPRIDDRAAHVAIVERLSGAALDREAGRGSDAFDLAA